MNPRQTKTTRSKRRRAGRNFTRVAACTSTEKSGAGTDDGGYDAFGGSLAFSQGIILRRRLPVTSTGWLRSAS